MKEILVGQEEGGGGRRRGGRGNYSKHGRAKHLNVKMRERFAFPYSPFIKQRF